jgi:CheY-like chemotaxis protein
MHPSTPDPEEPAPGVDSGLRVLVADDEAMIRRTIHRLLERRGHEVHEAEDAPRALDRLREHEYDAVLLDANMPGNGRSLLEALLERGFPGRIVLMTGAYAQDVAPDAPARVLRVQKPFDFDDFVRLVEGGDESES